MNNVPHLFIRLLLPSSCCNKLLNRNWSIEGQVQKGKQLGKKIGFPTANIDIKDYILACPGVYAVRVKMLNSSNIKHVMGCEDCCSGGGTGLQGWQHYDMLSCEARGTFLLILTPLSLSLSRWPHPPPFLHIADIGTYTTQKLRQKRG